MLLVFCCYNLHTQLRTSNANLRVKQERISYMTETFKHCHVTAKHVRPLNRP